jgi:hypothetical protein
VLGGTPPIVRYSLQRLSISLPFAGYSLPVARSSLPLRWGVLPIDWESLPIDLTASPMNLTSLERTMVYCIVLRDGRAESDCERECMEER